MGLGSWLGDRTGIHPTVIAGKVKDGVVGAGHAIGSVASNPWVEGALAAGLAATGVGAPAAAGIMAATRGGGALLKPGGNIGDGIKGGVEGAALGYGASKVGDALYGGLGSIGSGSGASAAGGLGGFLKDHAGQILGAGQSVLGGGLPGLPGGGGGGPGGLNPGIAAMAGLQVANAANLGAKQNDFTDRAWNLANDSYTSRAGLRSAGINGLLNPQTHDLSSLTALRQQNPVAARAGLPQRAV